MTAATRTPQLADWALSRGRGSLSTGDLASILDIPVTQVSERLSAPLRRGEWATPARGLWVPVPPEFRTWGAPPGIEVIDALAGHLDLDYYVGWLSAAQLHGVAHQSPQTFQVAVSRQVRDRQVGRTRFQFRLRHGIPLVPVEQRQTRSGPARVSTPEATALDVARDVRLAGGIDNAATVVVELDEALVLDRRLLAELASQYPSAAVRRLGWILQEIGGSDDLDGLREAASIGPPTPARLDPSGMLAGPIDARWNVRINRVVEADL